MGSTKYLFFDYDNTLSFKANPLSFAVIAALNRAKNAGHKLFICSGRCRYMLPKIEGVDFDGYVLACGTDVRVKDKTIVSHTISLESINEIATEAAAQKFTLILEGENAAICIPKKAVSWLSLSSKSLESCKLEFGKTFKLNKFTIGAPCTKNLIDITKKQGFYFIDHFHSGEFVPNGYSKLTGIQKVLEYYGADIKDCIAFGDSMNDYDMIKFAGTGVAMGNSVEALKSIADYVTLNVEDDGIAHYINNVLLKKEEII